MKLSLSTPEWAMPLIGDYRYKGAKGGRGSGKSHFFAEELVATCAAYPNTSAVCIREMQKSLKDSSKRLIEHKIAQLGVSHLFDITQAEIRHKHGNGIIIFLGMQSHNADSIKSLEAFKIAWVEEAQSLSDRSLRLLRPTMRSGSQLWFSWNPEFPEDPVEELFMHADGDENMRVVDVNWNDNPYFPEELYEEMERDRRIYSEQMWRHIWEGAYLTGDMGEVFKWHWFQAYETLPNTKPDMVVHSWDTAAKKAEHNDPSACTIWHIYGKRAYLVHVVNERMNYPEIKRKVKFMALKYPPDVVLVEDASTGQALIPDLAEEGVLNVKGIKPIGDKIARASSSTDKIAEGLVHVPSDAPWLNDYKKQLTRFSFSKELQEKYNDDMVDSTSQFVNWWKTTDSVGWTNNIKRIYGL